MRAGQTTSSISNLGESMRASSITGISANMVQQKEGNPTFS